jgi:3'(2'), 5'-bisphosphate nucleotidase
VFEKTRYVVLGRADGIQQRVIRRVDQMIRGNLEELNPDIPIISRLDNTVPYSKRRNWNHFWLVDPLDSNAGLLATGEDFTINIALIEDRRPVLGIIHAPVKNIIYYSMNSKDAFRIEAGKKQEIIEAHANREQKLPTHTGREGTSHQKKMDESTQPASIALAMCLTAEGKLDTTISLNSTKEWETAGAHAVIKATGMKLVNADSNSELSYNKEDFQNGPLILI